MIVYDQKSCLPVYIMNLLFYTGSNTQLKTQCANRTILSNEFDNPLLEKVLLQGIFPQVIIFKTQGARDLSGYLVEIICQVSTYLIIYFHFWARF